MKIVDWIAKIIVGGLFIFSGLIKINDPVGTQIKLEEYFEVFATDFGSFFHLFIPIALPIAFILIILEVLLGVAVLINFRMKISSWVLLILIFFFTFLTFYSAYFNKVTDCGCFGDAIPLTPWESFYKDLILVVLIAYIFVRRKLFDGLTGEATGNFTIAGTALATLIIGIYAVRHLPFIDFRPYKIGDNLMVNMQPLEEPIFEYTFRKDGELIKSEQYLSEQEGYEYIGYEVKNSKNTIPKITDFSVWNDEVGEYTDLALTGNKFILIVQDAGKASRKDLAKIGNLMKTVTLQAEVLVFTSSGVASLQDYLVEARVAVPIFFVDATVLKTMIRSNPGMMLMKDGTVLGKWHYNDIPVPDQVLNLL